MNQSNTKIPYAVHRTTINKFITDKRQGQWSSNSDYNLHTMKSTIGEWLPGYRKIRNEELLGLNDAVLDK